jgi:exonuclease SbcC
MRVDSVTARAFGPFRGEQLDLAPGLTVVAGPNEAGKSTWHAAVRAAICGMPRRRGRATAAEQEFADLHRPWDRPDEWLVSARLALDEGERCIEIRQDLGERLDSSAIELPIGRSVTGEILNEGSPDASRWLGLDRDAFAATVCVDQADILAVTAAAGSLQQHLQRAAATRGSDATAAEAIDRLKRFRSEHVGLDRPNAVRPLRQAIELHDAARQALETARTEHARYLEMAAAADEARQAHARAELRLRSAEVAGARRDAQSAAERARRARVLAERHPSEPSGAAERDRLADEVAAAIGGWTGRPEVRLLPGPDAAGLQAQLAGVEAELEALRDVPPGDRAPDPTVRDAREAWVASRDALALLGEAPPLPSTAAAGLSSAELDALATDLEARAPGMDASAGRANEVAETQRVAAERRVLTAGFVALVGAAVGVGGAVGAMLPIAALGAAVAIIAFVGWMRARSFVGIAREERRRTEAGLAPQAVARAAADARRAEAAQRLLRAGISDRAPDSVRSLAARVAAAESAARTRAEWESRTSLAMKRLEQARAALAAALLARGVPDVDDVEAAWRDYEAACATRATLVAGASRADALRSALTSRRQAEAQAQAAVQASDEARAALVRCAVRAGIPTGGLTEAAILEALRAWQGLRERDLRATSEARTEWEQLQALLDGRTLDDLEARAAALVRLADDRERDLATLVAAARSTRAGNLHVAHDPGVESGDGETIANPPSAAVAVDDAALDLAALAAEERRLLDEARSLAGRAADRASRLLDVAEAEEALQRAEEGLARVQRLDAALAKTAELLVQAQERVHRDIAPVLATAIRDRLAELTAGRYDDAAVDPASLAVRVREQATGRWRHAQRLSQGTREQVYLLLRAAMAQHLVTTGETAPLLLDEVTAQADEQRKAAMLGALLAMSRERQVILFTHDREVVEWARLHLDPSRDRLIELADRAVLPV